jgi:hypothetical protein
MGAVQLLLLFFAGLAVHSRPLTSVHPSLLNNPSAFPTSGYVLSIDTPLDPLRSKCVRGLSDDEARSLGHEKDKSVLEYLREMVRICQEQNHRDARIEYERVRDFVAQTIYGPLPPREQFPQAYEWKPDPKPATPPIWKQQLAARPLRRIIRRFTETDGSLWEILQCGHRVGTYSFESPWASQPGTLARHRRCVLCGEQAAEKKQPASATALKKKAVTA